MACSISTFALPRNAKSAFDFISIRNEQMPYILDEARMIRRHGKPSFIRPMAEQVIA